MADPAEVRRTGSKEEDLLRHGESLSQAGDHRDREQIQDLFDRIWDLLDVGDETSVLLGYFEV